MADKEKIRKEVEKRFEQIKNSKKESDSGAFYQLKELLEFIDSLQEEPVSDELEEAIEQSFIYHENRGDDFRSDEQIETTYRYGFESGANWKERQFEKNRIAHCDALTDEQAKIESDFVTQHLKENNRTPTFIDAIEYGMILQREDIMKDAVDAIVHIDAGNYPYIPQLELYDYDKDIPLAEEGDKYKIVLIKED